MDLKTNNHAADTTPVVIDNREFYRRLFNIALPIMVQHLMLALVAAGDALMLGQVAQEQMTAVSLASQIQFIQNMILAAFTMAGSILGAQYWGKGDKKTIQNLFHLMLRWAGAVSMLISAGTIFSSLNRTLQTKSAPLLKIMPLTKKASKKSLV